LVGSGGGGGRRRRETWADAGEARRRWAGKGVRGGEGVGGWNIEDAACPLRQQERREIGVERGERGDIELI